MIADDSFKMNQQTMRATAPRFSPEVIYSKWERDFKAFIRRIPECDFILNNIIKPELPIQFEDENKADFGKRTRQYETDTRSWERGNASLFSHLYEAVGNHTRAYNVVCQNDPSGLAALEALSNEFENLNIVKEQAIDLKAEFDNRKISKNETITQWISILENYRLRLKNYGIDINDENMANKIKTSMVSTENCNYSNALVSIIMVCPDINYLDLSSRLRRYDEILLKNNPNMISTNIISNAASSTSSCPPSAHFNHAKTGNGTKSHHNSNGKKKSNFKKFNKNKNKEKKDIPPPPLNLPQTLSAKCERCGKPNHSAAVCTLDWKKVKEINPKKE